MQLPVIWPNRIPFYKCLSFSLPPSADQKQAGRHKMRASKTLRIPSQLGSAYLLFPFSAVLFLSSVINLTVFSPGFSICDSKLESSFMTMSVEKELLLVSV